MAEKQDGLGLKDIEQLFAARAGPFIGRILTKNKFFAGKIEVLRISANGNEVAFRVANCDQRGISNGTRYQGEVPIQDLIQVVILRDRKGQVLSESSLKELLESNKPS